MPKPEPIWERWKKNPKTAEKLFVVYWIATIAVNVLVVIGFVILIIVLVKSR